MAFLKPLYRQSIKDLCNQAYGSLDNIIKFCNDNKISNINIPPEKECIFDKNLITNINYTGFKYATRHIDTTPTIIPETYYVSQNNDNFISQLEELFISN